MKQSLPNFITEQLKSNQNRGVFRCSTMLVDIKGFTPLTESLLQHGTEGAEILSKILDDIFRPMVAWVVAKGGIIPHFAGDAFTALFEDDKGAIVMDTAWKIKTTFDNIPIFKTPFGDFDINLRIGISYGIVEWGVLGDSLKAFYFKGNAIERAAAAQKKSTSTTNRCG